MLKKCFFSALGFVFSFVLLEGVSSFLILAHGIGISLLAHPMGFTHYDSELGWVSTPNYYDKDCFGPGVFLRTNSRGFRGNEETTDKIPLGKVRLLCSGDSFTMGVGVDDDHTWCRQLALMNNALETVNMGQGGYGVDQMYLSYRRDGSSLQHDIHILAVIGDDFRRMERTEMYGYPKPILRLQNGGLVVANVPVPRHVLRLDAYVPSFEELRSVQLASAVLKRISPSRPPSEPNTALRQVISMVIDELRSLNNRKNSILVLAYLPTGGDEDRADHSLPPWRTLLREEVAREGLQLIDLTEDFQKLPAQEVRRFFIPLNSSSVPSYARGHYSNEGNEFVARKLCGYMYSRPEIQSKFAEGQHIVATPRSP